MLVLMSTVCYVWYRTVPLSIKISALSYVIHAGEGDAIVMTNAALKPEIKPSRGDLRRQAIVQAASDVFLESGFAGTTLDKIIERSGGSRRTVYEHFGNKEGLFGAVVGQCCESILSDLEHVDIYGLSVRDALILIGTTLVQAITLPQNLAVFRLVVSEVARFPELGEQFYQKGPQLGMSRLADYLSYQVTQGHLKLDDPELAARHFSGLVKSELYFKAVLLPNYTPTAEQIRHDVEIGIDLFLNGARGKSPGA